MRRARRNSLLALIALIAVAAQPARPTKEDAARQQMEQAEQARAAEQAAAAGRRRPRRRRGRGGSQRLADDRIAAAAKLRAGGGRNGRRSRPDGRARRTSSVRRRQAWTRAAETMQPLAAADRAAVAVPGRDAAGRARPAGGHAARRAGAARPGAAARRGRRGAAPASRSDWRTRNRRTPGRGAEAGSGAGAGSSRKPPRWTGSIAARRPASTHAEASAAEPPAAPRTKPPEPTRCAAMLAELETQRRRQQAKARDDAAPAPNARSRLTKPPPRGTRQAELERPTGAGTIASAAQPHGQLTAPVAGTIVRSWGDATDGGPATGISYQAPPAARVVSIMQRPRGVRRAVPQLRVAVDRRLRRRLPCRAGRVRPARREGRRSLSPRASRSGVMPGWEPAKAGQSAHALCRVAPRRAAGEPCAVAEGKRLTSHRRKI